jgi:predicted phosphodiesterase
MRYGIFSDIHSNLEAFNAVIEAYRKESIDKYLCIGDVVGYAANPKECTNLVKEISMITIAGNHDWAVVNLFSVDCFNPLAAQAIFWAKRNLDNNSVHFLESLRLVFKNEDLTLVHGTLNSPESFHYMLDSFIAEDSFSSMETNICFIGHTHVPGIFIKDKDSKVHYCDQEYINIKPQEKYIINVGSVGQPRDNNPKASFCLYDTDKKEVRIKRVDYNIETARRKIINAGLPNFLGDRLLLGR